MNELAPQVDHENPQDGNQLTAQRGEPGLPSPPSPRKFTDQQQVVMDRIQAKSSVIRDMAFPAAMAAAIPVAKDIGSAAFKVYRDGVIKAAGGPTDPVEIMLIEQLTLAHHRVAQLHAQAEQAKTAEEAKVYMTAAVRLTGELRRLALALHQYRQPLPRRQFTLIKQQNLSRAGQQIAYVDHGIEFQPQVPSSSGDGELAGTERLKLEKPTVGDAGVSPESQDVAGSGVARDRGHKSDEQRRC